MRTDRNWGQSRDSQLARAHGGCKPWAIGSFTPTKPWKLVQANGAGGQFAWIGFPGFVGVLRFNWLSRQTVSQGEEG